MLKYFLILILLIPTVSALDVEFTKDNMTVDGVYFYEIYVYYGEEEDNPPVAILKFSDCDEYGVCEGKHTYDFVYLIKEDGVKVEFDENYYFYVNNLDPEGSEGFQFKEVEECETNDDCEEGEQCVDGECVEKETVVVPTEPEIIEEIPSIQEPYDKLCGHGAIIDGVNFDCGLQDDICVDIVLGIENYCGGYGCVDPDCGERGMQKVAGEVEGEIADDVMIESDWCIQGDASTFGKKNFDVKGKIETNKKTYTDRCLENGNLREYFCKRKIGREHIEIGKGTRTDNNGWYLDVDCEFGCYEGACKSLFEPSKSCSGSIIFEELWAHTEEECLNFCQNTQGATCCQMNKADANYCYAREGLPMFYNNKEVTALALEGKDIKSEEEKVEKKQILEKNVGKEYLIDYEGECYEENDIEKDYYNKGTVVGKYVDYCNVDGNLIEFYCKDYNPYYQQINCRWGCYDGRCRDGEFGSPRCLGRIDLLGYCSPGGNEFNKFKSCEEKKDDGKNYQKYGYIHVEIHRENWFDKSDNYKDFCYNKNVLIENFCGPIKPGFGGSNAPWSIDKYCKYGCEASACVSVFDIGSEEEINLCLDIAKNNPENCDDYSCMVIGALSKR